MEIETDFIPELTKILDEDGYVAECQPGGDGSWLVVEHNCAILDVAARYGAACESEIAFIRAVLPGTRVERVRHKMSGDFVCAYRVTATRGFGTPRQPGPPAAGRHCRRCARRRY